ncbi:hypothetical protein L1049_017358 [Liquidambar formosana]|uniref:Ribosomal protein L13 n=1 Tax=Liquidambar formosana TaxID=63359 RepID=A0AAP0S0R4_LIQFO
MATTHGGWVYWVPNGLTLYIENRAIAGARQVFVKCTKAVAGLRRINLEGLRWRVFDAKDQLSAKVYVVTRLTTNTPMLVTTNTPMLIIKNKNFGHLKERSLKDQLAKDPTEVIRKTVLRMLPRNKLRNDRD